MAATLEDVAFMVASAESDASSVERAQLAPSEVYAIRRARTMLLDAHQTLMDTADTIAQRAKYG